MTAVVTTVSLDAVRLEYIRMFADCVVVPAHAEEVESTIDAVLHGRMRYQQVAFQTAVPWWFIGIVHQMECGGSWRQHLHNGDPLTARTVQVPAGRPIGGVPPFDWTYSAVDALRYEKLDHWTDWTLAGTLWKFEGYNGFGYRKLGVPSPYLWSYSNQYAAGKFVADGKYSSTAVSRQVGAATLLRRLVDQKLIPALN